MIKKAVKKKSKKVAEQEEASYSKHFDRVVMRGMAFFKEHELIFRTFDKVYGVRLDTIEKDIVTIKEHLGIK